MSTPAPGIVSSTRLAPIQVLARPTGSVETIEVIIPAGYGPLLGGETLGQITSGGAWVPQKRTRLTAAVSNPTAVSTITVAQAAGFRAGDIVDIVDGADGSTELFADKTILSVNYQTNQITFAAALGASTALDIADFVRLATADGAEVARLVNLGITEASSASVATSDDQAVPGLISGLVYKSHLANVDTYAVSTNLGMAQAVNDIVNVR